MSSLAPRAPRPRRRRTRCTRRRRRRPAVRRPAAAAAAAAADRRAAAPARRRSSWCCSSTCCRSAGSVVASQSGGRGPSLISASLAVRRAARRGAARRGRGRRRGDSLSRQGHDADCKRAPRASAGSYARHRGIRNARAAPGGVGAATAAADIVRRVPRNRVVGERQGGSSAINASEESRPQRRPLARLCCGRNGGADEPPRRPPRQELCSTYYCIHATSTPHFVSVSTFSRKTPSSFGGFATRHQSAPPPLWSEPLSLIVTLPGTVGPHAAWYV